MVLFRLNQTDWLPVVAPQDIVDVSDTGAGRHAVHLVLLVPGLLQLPSRFTEQSIDLVFAGLGLRPVMRLRRDRFGRCLGRCDLGQQDETFGFELLYGLRSLFEIETNSFRFLKLPIETLLKISTLLERTLLNRLTVHQQIRVEPQGRIRL